MWKLLPVACAVLLLGACDPTNPASGPVCVWGDSIAAQSLEELQYAFQVRDFAYDLDVVGVIPGYGYRDFASYFQQRIEDKRGVQGGNCATHLVALGTNDQADKRDTADYEYLIDQFLGALGNVPVVLVAPNPHSAKGTTETRAAFADAITNVEATHNNVHVLRFMESFEPSDYDSPAEVHLSPAGQTKWADKVEDAFDLIYPSPSSAHTELDGSALGPVGPKGPMWPLGAI